MRENRTYGSEGGEGFSPFRPLSNFSGPSNSFHTSIFGVDKLARHYTWSGITNPATRVG